VSVSPYTASPELPPMGRQRELDLTGKVAIVTGASRGVGRQAAIDFARRGAKVVLAARTVDADNILPGSMGEALHTIETLGGEALAVQTDLANPADLKKLVEAAVERFGGVDILVNNAAVTVSDAWSKKFLDLPLEDWLYQFDVNLHAPFILMQLVVPIMESRGGGRIVNITTGSGEVFRHAEEPVALASNAGRNLIMPGYFASKRALDKLGNVIAPDLAPRNVYVIGMHPGWVASEVVQERMKKISVTESQARVTDGPIPMTIPARMIVYFASCENPAEYTGRLFWAEREKAAMGVPDDATETAVAA
jgi:NAD(P)-dependent dehydrogenase (short-subunit alcohol dehydrogenase family)